jgi:hypothetical protein
MNQDARSREIAELKTRLAALEASPTQQNKRPQAPQAPQVDRAGKVIGAVALTMGFLLAVGYMISLPHSGATSSEIQGAQSGSAASDAIAQVDKPVTSPAAPPDTSPWTYSDETDAMGRTAHFACSTSTNQVSQSAPYNDVDAELCIRKKPGRGLSVYVQLNGNGQILCGIEECTLPVRFGDGPITRVSASPAADGSSNVIFLNSERSVFSRLKRAEKVVVELTLYQNGSQGVSFKTDGLKWNS